MERGMWTVGMLSIIAVGTAIAQRGQAGGQPGSAPGRQPGAPAKDSAAPPPGAPRAPGPGLVTQADIDHMTALWPEASRRAIRDMTAKYGPPNTAADMMVVWRNNGPWKYSIIYGAEVPHSFPSPHGDVVEQFIDFRVPAEKVGDLALFDGSLIVARTAGLLASWCDSEAMNFLALNLANEIMTGKRTPEDARQFFAQEAMNYKQGKPSTYTQGFMFELETGRRGDPDRPVAPIAAPPTQSPAAPDQQPPGEPPPNPGSTEPGNPR